MLTLAPLLLALLLLVPVQAAPKCSKKKVGTSYEDGCNILTCTKKGRKYKWVSKFNPTACCKEGANTYTVGQVLSEDLLDPACSGECQVKKIWCVAGVGQAPSKLETWVTTQTIEAGAGSCPAVLKMTCSDNEATCANPPAADGCPTGTYCLPRSGDCPLTCPITCPSDHLFCPNRPLTVNGQGCEAGGLCVAIPPPDTTPACPAVCPTTCQPGEIACDLGTDAQGCHLGTQCLAQHPGPCPATCPVTCPEGQVHCAGPVDATGCPWPDTCVPSDGVCPTRCPVHCGPKETSCPLGTSEAGCDRGSVCVPAMTTNPLQSHPTYAQGHNIQAECSTPCPAACSGDQLQCSLGSDNGCHLGWYCMEATPAAAACPAFCPVTCDPLTHQLCDGGVDAQGCPKPGICLERPLPSAACPAAGEPANCPLTCPLICSETERTCPGTSGPDGCPMPGTCLPAHLPGTNCTSACPANCPPDQMACWLPPSPDGCDMGSLCIPTMVGDCPNHCPMVCADGEVQCPSHGTDSGSPCPGAPTCLVSTAACPARCPPLCGQDEYQHPMGTDETGCDLGWACVKNGLPGSCTANPPVHCNNDSITCPGSYDNEGCYSGDWCQPRGSCPAPTCPSTCQEGEMPCSHPPSHPDCPATTFCIPETVPAAPNPNHQGSCPNTCPPAAFDCPDGMVCPGSVNVDGCPTGSYCMAAPQALDGGVCPVFCEPDCDYARELVCSPGTDPRGCPMASYCIPMFSNGTSGQQCPTHCPATCPTGAMTCPGGTSADGCPLNNVCSSLPTADCPAACPALPCHDAAYCPTMDQQGCDLGGYCLPRSPGCTTIPTCPALCFGTDILCTSPATEAGCPDTSSYCMPGTQPHPTDPALTCPSRCTLACPPGETAQSLGMDSQGCPQGHTCLPAAHTPCPPCPGGISCPALTPGAACTCAMPPPAIFVDLVLDTRTADSPCEASCPCGPGEMPCPTGMDWITTADGSAAGCPRPDQCLKMSTGNCPTTCPPLCTDGQVPCAMGTDSLGCHLGHTCMEPAACAAIIPA